MGFPDASGKSAARRPAVKVPHFFTILARVLLSRMTVNVPLAFTGITAALDSVTEGVMHDVPGVS
jgi:hypothetical protein